MGNLAPRMIKPATFRAVCAALFLFAPLAARADRGTQGTITRVDADLHSLNVAVQFHRISKGEQKFTVDAATEIRVDGTVAPLAGLKPGMRVIILGTTLKPVLSVTATSATP